MSETFRLYGFAFPTESGNTFSTPVFSKGERYYVQVIDGDDGIADFEAIDSRSISCQENSETRIVNGVIGQYMQFAINSTI